MRRIPFLHLSLLLVHNKTQIPAHVQILSLQSKTGTMTAKAVRTELMAKNPGWKMPAERRIAKFVK